MGEGILKVIDSQANNIQVTTSNEPLVVNKDEISFTTCVEIPAGFKVYDLRKINIKYYIDKSKLVYTEFSDDIVAEILNNITILNVKGVRLSGTLNYTIYINGFSSAAKYNGQEYNYPISSSGTINISSNLCYYLTNSNIDLDKLEALYSIYTEVVDTFLFTQENKMYKLLDENKSSVNKESEFMLLNNIDKKYIILNSKITIENNRTTQS